ncbi:MAG TPA: DUF2007 domain-containing protein, partial [Blastocatellia bacterium]|nr:DUF2007 domain-containing protein [Blastocatellia bacterium]
MSVKLDRASLVATYSQPPDLELVELCRPASYTEAMIVKQLLEQNGIPSVVKGGHSMSLMPYLAAAGELRVLVDRTRLDEARALYEGYFENDGDTD